MHSHPHFENPYLTYSPTFACADNILFGCCLCALLRTKWRDAFLRVAQPIFWSILLVLLIVAIPSKGLDWIQSPFIPGKIFIQTFGFTLLGIASACLIAMSLSPGLTQQFLGNRVLRFFGKYSYGLYVYHFSVYGITLPLRKYFNPHIHSKALTIVLVALIAGTLSVAMAVLSYHLYEVHFLRLKRFFSYHRMVKTV